MEGFFALVLVLTVSLAATSTSASRLRRSRPIVLILSGGWLWLLLGVAIGPHGLGGVDQEITLRMTPLVAFALGWVGLMIGLGAHKSVLVSLPVVVRRSALFDATSSVVVFGGLTAMALMFLHERFAVGAEGLPDQLLLVGLLAVCGMGWAMETRSLRADSNEISSMLSIAVRGGGGLVAIVAIALWGLVDVVIDADVTRVLLIDPVHIALVFVAVAIGVLLLGLVTRSALRLAGDNSSELLTVFVGVVALISGVSMQMGVPAMLAGMLMGVLLTNLAGKEVRRFERFLLEAEHIVAVVLSLVAGLMLDMRIGMGGVILAVLLAGGRAVCKPAVLMAAMRSEVSGEGHTLRFVGVRQSPVALALGVSFVLGWPGDWSHRVLGIVVLTGLLSEVIPLWMSISHRSTPMATTTTPDLEVPAQEQESGSTQDSAAGAEDETAPGLEGGA